MPTPEEPRTAGRVPALQASGMTKTFGEKVAVGDVDLTLWPGEIHALLGENGAGKSTLISMLCGQYRPDAGSLAVAGDPVSFSTPRDSLDHGIGVVHQDYRLVDDFSVLENLVLGTKDAPSKAAWARATAILERVGFVLPRDTPAGALSVGEKQQVEILKLLMRGAKVLILDEPTAVLTPQQAENLFAALRVLADDGTAVAFVSHKLREVARVADRVSVLRGGRLVHSAPAGKVTGDDLAALMMGAAVDVSLDVAPQVAGEPVLDLQDVTSGGGGRGSLRGVTLQVARHEIVGVAGVSGNGQSDLARIAAGAARPDGGRRSTAPGARVRYVPEDRLADGLVGSMSIAANLALRSFGRGAGRQPLLVSRSALAERAQEPIAAFNIPATATTRAGQLSGGGQQRVILARELATTPDLLVVCQPTRGLDVVSAVRIRELLLEVRAAGGGVLLVSEDLDELLELCDRVVVLTGGELAAEFPRGTADRAAIGARMVGADADQPTPTPEVRS